MPVAHLYLAHPNPIRVLLIGFSPWVVPSSQYSSPANSRKACTLMFSARRIVPPPSPLSTDQSLETTLSIARAMLHPSLGVLLQYLPGIRFLRVYAPFLLGCLWFLSLHTHSLSCSHSTAPCLPNFWLPQARTFFWSRPCAPCVGARSTSKVEEDKKNTANWPCSRIDWRMLGPTPQAAECSARVLGSEGPPHVRTMGVDSGRTAMAWLFSALPDISWSILLKKQQGLKPYAKGMRRFGSQSVVMQIAGSWGLRSPGSYPWQCWRGSSTCFQIC